MSWVLPGWQIAQCKKELIQSNAKPYPKVLALRPWYKWIGKIGDWSRFSNRCKVACFFGFVPREYSTGTTQPLGSITKVGSA
jgi:hypothetical protein